LKPLKPSSQGRRRSGGEALEAVVTRRHTYMAAAPWTTSLREMHPSAASPSASTAPPGFALGRVSLHVSLAFCEAAAAAWLGLGFGRTEWMPHLGIYI